MQRKIGAVLFCLCIILAVGAIANELTSSEAEMPTCN